MVSVCMMAQTGSPTIPETCDFLTTPYFILQLTLLTINGLELILEVCVNSMELTGLPIVLEQAGFRVTG